MDCLTPLQPDRSTMDRKETNSNTAGRFAYDGLERVLHEKARLGIISCLAANTRTLTFTELKELCSLTDGNLNRHLKVLEEAGIVAITKKGLGRRTTTVCDLTQEGRQRFLEYIQALQSVVQDANASLGSESSSAAEASDPQIGWSS